MARIALSVAVLVTAAAMTQAAEGPEGNAVLWPRWRATRHAVQMIAEQTNTRWAMPASVSRRAFIGSADLRPIPAKDLVADLCRQTGLVAEMLNGILVVHAPDEARRRELVARVAGDDATERLDAVCELGWLKDAHAWPDLAKMVAGADIALALAAAQALRRLDGEEDLDWRLVGVSADDPESVEKTRPRQVPIGAVFPDCVTEAAVGRLAGSLYLPLREAAARLAPSLGGKGRAVAERLAGDPALVVRRAARRALRAFDGAFPAPGRLQVATRRHEWHVTDLKAAELQLRRANAPEEVWRLTGRRIGYTGTPEAVRTLIAYGSTGARWSPYVTIPLAEFGGGSAALEWLVAQAAGGDGWALWGLSALQDGSDLAGSMNHILTRGKPQWDAPPEYTAARWAGLYALDPLLAGMGNRNHWICLALGHIGGPEAVRTLAGLLRDTEAGVAVAAAKGLGDTAAYDALEPLIGQLKAEDRLHRHWAVLGLWRIGGPEAQAALTDLLREEEKRQDRLVRRAAAEALKELGPLGDEARRLIETFEEDDADLVPEYRPRNALFGEDFPENTEIAIPEFRPLTYAAVGRTSVVMDWANRLMIRYGGSLPAVHNECFALDVGSGTWFPIRAASLFVGWNNEVRPNAGAPRGMAFDGLNKVVWIGAGPPAGAGPNPGMADYGQTVGLAAYDAATDRFSLPEGAPEMASAYRGEPATSFAFDADTGLVLSSRSGARGIGTLDVRTRRSAVRPAPRGMPEFEHDPPPAFAYDPVAKLTMNFHPKNRFRTVLFDAQTDTVRWSEARFPGLPHFGACGGLVYDSLNRAMLVIGGTERERGETMPTCLYDRAGQKWVDLKAKNLGQLGGQGGLTVFDPEHNVFLGVLGGAYRYLNVEVGTRAFYGGGIGSP